MITQKPDNVKAKTYFVYYKDDEYGEYVKAKSEGKAKVKASFAGDGDYIDLRAVRIPTLDKYDIITNSILIKEGLRSYRGESFYLDHDAPIHFFYT